MDEKTLEALTALATKLGTTAEYLWGVLLKQAPISASIDLLVMAAWITAIALWARFVSRKTKDGDWTEEGAFFAWVSAGVAALVAALIIGLSLSSTLSALLNPEYWALKQILK